MERIGGEERHPPTSTRQVALASFIGTTVEWYDFFLYGTAAALVFGPLFFPSDEPLTGTLIAFATLAVGFVARPIGGIVFGHFGDKIGRKTMLVLTLLIMGVATFAIGLLPTYDSIGIWAPILLVFLRICQGLAVGGEWGGAVLMAVEHAPTGRRGFFGSFPQAGAGAGLLISTGVFAIFSALPDEQFLSWGWRMPFLLSLVLIVVGLYIRLKIAESPAFDQVKEKQEEADIPFLELIRNHPKNILLSMGARLSEGVGFNIYAVFSLTYIATELGLPRSVALTGVLIAAALELVACPAFGALSDRIGRRPVYMAGATFSALFAFPFFWLVGTEVPALIWLGIVLGLAVGKDLMYGPQAAFFSELFSTRVRYSGASVGYQLSGVISSGVAPFIATALLAWSGGEPWPIAVYVIVMALISLVSAYLAPETYRDDIEDSAPDAAPAGVGTATTER